MHLPSEGVKEEALERLTIAHAQLFSQLPDSCTVPELALSLGSQSLGRGIEVGAARALTLSLHDSCPV